MLKRETKFSEQDIQRVKRDTVESLEVRLATGDNQRVANDVALSVGIEYVHAELAPEDKLAVSRARKIQRFLSQPFHVAEVFTGSPGKFVSLKDTIRGFKMIVSGECDELPEQAFYMVGGIEEAFEKAKTLQ